MPTLHLPIGPVGAGKSTWARRQQALFIDVDTWMVRLFGADPRPAEGVLSWYLERRDRVRRVAWSVARDALELDQDVVLELGLVQRAEREEAFRTAQLLDAELDIVCFDLDREERWSRVQARNEREGAQVVPRALFDMASDAWQPPDDDEVRTWSIR